MPLETKIELESELKLALESVEYDPVNQQVQNVIAFFATRLPDQLCWTLKVGDRVEPGAVIGYWHWDDDGSTTDIRAPEACSGYLADKNDGVRYESLRDQSCVLLKLSDKASSQKF
jgi:hypothetical protein